MAGKMEVQYEWVEQAFRPAVELPQRPASAAEVQLELLISSPTEVTTAAKADFCGSLPQA
jgi:hypothetical protein